LIWLVSWLVGWWCCGGLELTERRCALCVPGGADYPNYNSINLVRGTALLETPASVMLVLVWWCALHVRPLRAAHVCLTSPSPPPPTPRLFMSLFPFPRHRSSACGSDGGAVLLLLPSYVPQHRGVRHGGRPRNDPRLRQQRAPVQRTWPPHSFSFPSRPPPTLLRPPRMVFLCLFPLPRVRHRAPVRT
jgi:hypothetical protein